MQKTNRIKKGDIISGFEILKKEAIKEQAMVYYELVHIKTGAKYIHLETDDQENTFCVAFKTLPEDSTGVAHILEHIVLMGSKKYPVRDPFFSMLKRSLNTFMNAFTSSDWTAYPFATQNKKDFYNLLSVYLDAVFFPEISELSFMQEGCRLDYNGKELVYKGVVYNEMKGSMSSVDRVAEQAIMSILYPNSTYRFNSGGDPKIIPQLTHQKLIEFHKRFYHPSNARFYSYGSLPLLKHLHVLDKEILSKFSKIDPKTGIKPEPRWQKEKEAVFPFPIAKEEEKAKKYQVGMSWMMAEAKNSYEILILEILEYVLLGSQASPLRKALLSSGLGSDLSDGSGFDSENSNTMFSVGLKDVQKKDKAKIKKIILDTLEATLKNGIDQKLLRAALQKQEFSKREKSNTPYPYGLSLYLRIISPWLHDGEPLEIMRYERQLKKLRIDLKKKRFLENRLKKYFTSNTHRALIVLEPDSEMQAKAEKAEKAKLAEINRKMTTKEKAGIAALSEKLKKRQETTDDINVLPTLELSDVSPGISRVKHSVPKGNKEAFLFKQNTNGLFYTMIRFGINNIDLRLLPLVPFFCYVIQRMGTRKKTYDEFAREIGLVSGGMSFSASAQSRQEASRDMVASVLVNSKSLEKNIGKMMELINELIREHDFADTKRLKELFREYLAKFEADMVQSGHQYASLLSGRGFSEVHSLNEQWHGISQYRYLKEKNPADLINDLKSLAAALFAKNNIKFCLVGSKAGLETGLRQVKLMQKSLPEKVKIKQKKEKFVVKKIREAWTLASAVSYSACTFESLPIGHKDAPTIAVISRILTMSYLMKELREKRGAYGGFAKYNPQEKTFTLGSYRDPHVYSTINVIDSAFRYIRKENFSDVDIKEAILSVVAEIDKPDSPAEAAINGFRRLSIGLSDLDRLNFKQRLLSVTKADVKRTANKYFQKKWTDLSVVFIGNEAKLKKANQKLKENKLDLHKII